MEINEGNRPSSPGGRGRPAAALAAKSGAASLKPAASPWGRLGGAIAIALLWNGFISVIVVSGFQNVLLVPFELLGLVLIGGVFYYFLALFNPRPVLRVSAASAALGDSVEIEWQTTGNVHRAKTFTITLEGREEATYRRGTSWETDKSTFATIEIVKASRGQEMRRGKATLVIPADSMHTFKSSNNKFLWSFHVKGDIPRWPDVDEEYPFEVLPQRLPPGGAT